MTATQPNAGTAAPSRDVRDQINEAVAHGRALRIVGGGSWIQANRPVRAEVELSVAGLTDIVEYEPGDLTLTARAGVTLDAIGRATAAHGQWLALDPPGDPTRATIGATIATASYGPLAHHFGAPRDMTLGVEFVTGSGSIARGGGRVVKNVAGFDLTRLVTGAWGSLGVITEVTVRLRALPAVETTLAVSLDAAPDRVEALRRAFRALPFTPLAAQWIDARLAHALDVSDSDGVVLVRLGGNEEAVRAQRATLESLGNAPEVGRGVWDRLRVADPVNAASLRLSGLPSEFGTTWSVARRVIERWPGAYYHGDAARGVVRCVLPLDGANGADGLSAVLRIPFARTRIFERLPTTFWPLVPPAVRTPLEHRIKAAFDPHGILNPGILGEVQ
jgi:glycolate oxidase FAD binding subunit